MGDRSTRDGITSDKLAREVIESLFEGCQVIGPDWTYLYVNETVARQGRRTKAQLIGRTMSECYPGIETTPMFSILRECMENRDHHRMENEFTFPDGSTGWFELRFVPIPEGVCILSVDTTESKRSELASRRTEAQLRHAQTIEAVGRLAGGIAHDFNNALSIILSYAEMAFSTLPENDPLRSDIHKILLAGNRSADLTKQLLAFSRQQVFELKIVDINQSLTSLKSTLHRLVGADVSLTMILADDIGKVNVDPGQLEQVVMNLVVNARDAMPTGGQLTFETTNVELGADYVSEHVDVVPGPYVMLAVSDTGLGMDKATQARIFEPFFTTREQGKGTGLGLATVFGIVKQSGGHIWVSSEPGNGTTFRIYIPRATGESNVNTAKTPQESIPPERGHETILLVEDDEHVRFVARGILQQEGYTVLEAANGAEALLLCEQTQTTIDLLLTDVALPRMSGAQIAARALSLRPNIKVLFMSGYTTEAVLQYGLLQFGIAYLQKPFTPRTLTRKVQATLRGE